MVYGVCSEHLVGDTNNRVCDAVYIRTPYPPPTINGHAFGSHTDYPLLPIPMMDSLILVPYSGSLTEITRI